MQIHLTAPSAITESAVKTLSIDRNNKIILTNLMFHLLQHIYVFFSINNASIKSDCLTKYLLPSVFFLLFVSVFQSNPFPTKYDPVHLC